MAKEYYLNILMKKNRKRLLERLFWGALSICTMLIPTWFFLYLLPLAVVPFLSGLMSLILVLKTKQAFQKTLRLKLIGLKEIG